MRLDSTKFHLDGGVNMAIYHFTTRIMKSSIGKCVVASAAYISGQKLKDARLGLSLTIQEKKKLYLQKYSYLKMHLKIWLIEKLYGMQLKKGKINETVSMQRV